jgi:penicillin-binding protein 1A
MSKGGKRRSAPRTSGRRAEGEPPSVRGRWRILYFLTIGGVWFAVGVAAVLAYFAADLPSTDGLWRQERTHAVTLLDVHGRVIARRGIDSGLPVTLQDLPVELPRAVLASEDRRFYSHFGLDFWGLGRAAWVNMNAGRVVQGGSTITQQLAKNLFLKPERTMGRKIQEALLAVYLEMSYSKDEILTLYLNRVYFGAGAYGVDAAARRYFNKPASKLSLVESAILAGLLKAPTRYSRDRTGAAAGKRRVAVHGRDGSDQCCRAGGCAQDAAKARDKCRDARQSVLRRLGYGAVAGAGWAAEGRSCGADHA